MREITLASSLVSLVAVFAQCLGRLGGFVGSAMTLYDETMYPDVHVASTELAQDEQVSLK